MDQEELTPEECVDLRMAVWWEGQGKQDILGPVLVGIEERIGRVSDVQRLTRQALYTPAPPGTPIPRKWLSKFLQQRRRRSAQGGSEVAVT